MKFKTLNTLRAEIKEKSLQLNELAYSNHNIDEFNKLFNEIKSLKMQADALEVFYVKCG